MSTANSYISDIVAHARNLLTTKRPILIAIDGRSGVGKSTIAGKFALELPTTIIVGDDFYSGAENGDEDSWHAKSPQEKVNKVIDWRRLRKEVLEPLLSGEKATYRPFDFENGYGLSAKQVELLPTGVIILEGAYSSRPELQDLIDISVLIEALDIERRGRLKEREGAAFMGEWHNKWDEAEELYFSEIRPREKFDYIIKN